jgi:hypothetical protein
MSSSALAFAGSYSLAVVRKSGSYPATPGAYGVCAGIAWPLRRIAISSLILYERLMARRNATLSGV